MVEGTMRDETLESQTDGRGNAPEMLTVGEAADLLGVSISTLRNWDRQGKLRPVRHPMNDYRLYPADVVLKLRAAIEGRPVDEPETRRDGVEQCFDVPFVTPLAFAEKQIQQSYRPYIQVHKWFARRPGTLFRALLLAEFGDGRPLASTFHLAHDFSGKVIFDPFMGGGTPAVEANRLGMNVVGCDINPMAAWIVRQELGPLDLKAFMRAAGEVASRVQTRVGQYYRTRCRECGRTADVKYFIWVKRVQCGACGQPVELLPGFLVAGNARHPNYVLFCPCCRDLFELPTLPERGETVTCTKCRGTFLNEPAAQRNRYVCRACGHEGRYPDSANGSAPPEHSLIAIEYHCSRCKPGHDGRFFKAPDKLDRQTYEHACADSAEAEVREWLPSESIPPGDETRRLHRWGYNRYIDMFNPRQLLGLGILAGAIAEVVSAPIRHALATVFSDFLRYQNMLCRYDTYALKCQDIFSVHGFPVGLVQCENNIVGIPRVGSGGFRHFVEKYTEAKRYCEQPFETTIAGRSQQSVPVVGERIGAEFTGSFPSRNGRRQAWLVCAPSADVPLMPGSVDAVVTDPPYFDNLQYAELMDFCYVWLRRMVSRDMAFFSGETTRSAAELTGNKTEGRDLLHFTEGMSRVYRNAASALRPGGLFAFTYHHNDTEAYLPLIVALCDAGLVGTASIPCPAEMSASLHIARTGSSVVDTVVCCRQPGGDVPPAGYVPESFLSELARQGLQLLQGGLDPTYGDLRCMALGLAAVHCINRLGSAWNMAVPVAERLAAADACLSDALKQAGRLDALVTQALEAIGQEKKAQAARAAARQPRLL